jgi:hypothetical protein
MILASLRRRPGRALALLLGILVATTGFTVLTATRSVARLQVTDTVHAHARSAYDILVRPAGSRTEMEEQRGLVRPNFLSGQFGGITLAQWRQIEAMRGVEIAAPVAMFGYAQVQSQVTVDLTPAVDRGRVTQVLRLDRRWVTDRGLSSVVDPATQYVYVTRRPVVWSTVDITTQTFRWTDGKTRTGPDRCAVAAGGPAAAPASAIEIQEDGSERPLCRSAVFSGDDNPGDHPSLTVAQLLPDGRFRQGAGREPSEHLEVHLPWPISMLLAGVDPASEARLVDLDRAVISGRYLGDAAVPPPSSEGLVSVPVLASVTPYVDLGIEVSVDRLDVPPDADIGGPGWLAQPPQVPASLTAAPGVPALRDAYQVDAAYRQVLTNPSVTLAAPATVDRPAITVNPDGTLTVAPAPPVDQNALRQHVSSTGTLLSPFVADTAFRTLTPLTRDLPDAQPRLALMLADVVGTFDPGKIKSFSTLSAVSLETYQVPQLAGADQASRQLLGDRPLLPNGSPVSYLDSPPLLLTSLEAPVFAGRPAPISAIRVRVADVHGIDPVSRERVRLAAEEIQQVTGLDVDIVIGSSPEGLAVVLPAGEFGRPQLTLTEPWSHKGVALSIIRAVDHKSLLLFGLILVVCVIFLANAVAAAVRERRRELAILACLGWSRGRLALLVAGEVALIGLLAGLLSTALALPVAAVADVALTGLHALLAVPVAMGLTLVAALVPAWRASRPRPPAALTVMGAAPRRVSRFAAARHRTVFGVALANLRRRPGRVVLAALALALGVAALTVLTAINWAFHGAVTGSLLGNAVSLQVRAVDTVAVAAMILFGLVAIADVLYLNVRDRAGELAALRAAGWSPFALGRLIAFEGLVIGLLGAVPGAAGGLAAAAAFAGELTTDLVTLAVAVAAGGVLLVGVAALVPAILPQHRQSLSPLLAEE